MSSMTHGQRAARNRPVRRSVSTSANRRQPYFVMNGATMVSIAAIALTVIGLLYLIQTSQVAQLGYDMSRLQSQRDTMTLEMSELEYELARYESLQTVEEVAVSQLGMAPMTNYEFVQIQAPAERNLVIPEQDSTEAPGFFERFQNALFGVGTAGSDSIDLSEYSLDESAP
jgi:cell division protein FtsL